jgi:DNA helicase-2/ATP-dependent DNA helicase PcrA
LSLHLEHLNPEQLAAVTAPDEHALILAGAGSGKTRVLTTRIAWLIKGARATPANILAVTFTNKAAREMLTRVTAMLPVNPRGMWIGTFHGLANRMLRMHHRDAGLPQTFTILDSQDQLAALKRMLKAMNVDEERYPPRELMYFINGQKEEGTRARDVQVTDETVKGFTDLYAAYDDQCQREGVVDFAELLLRCYELLSRNEILREHYSQRFRHILVDEFQDTNRLQYRWLKLMAGGSSFLFAVGDDDQSIYTFRGANVGNMADFERDFKVKNVVRLEQNYRSHGNILDAANALISNNRNRLGKNLWTAAGKGEPLRVFEGESDNDEARWLVAEVQALAREGTRLSHVGILYRSNAQSRVVEHALFSQGIAYRVYGGLRFFERAEIKHALAYLRLVTAPDDDNAFLRVVNFPTRGIGGRTLEQLQDAAKQAGSSLMKAAEGTKAAAFKKLIDDLRGEVRGLPLPEVIEVAIARSGLIEHYKNEREGLEEERRLAYVAITRARNRLYLSHAQTRMLHGQTRYNIPSRFLDEIPEALMKWLTPRFSKQKAFQPDFSRQTQTTFKKPVAREVNGFRIGQNVVHPKFGAGVIVDLEGQGGDVRVQVNFRGHGLKVLALAMAKLQAA